MKRYFITVSVVIQLLLAGHISALEKLSEDQLRNINAQAGISIAVNNASVYMEADNLKLNAVNNMNAFGELISGTGFFSLNDLLGLVVFDCEAHIDVGTYNAPDEHLFITDIGKDSSIINDLINNDHYYVGWYLGSQRMQADPYYWEIGDDITRPLDGKYCVIQASVQELTSILEVKSSISFCEKDIGSFGVSGISMPEFNLNDTNLPGSVITLFPGPECSVNLEMRLRLSLDEFKLSGRGSSGTPDFVVSGVHLGEAFGTQLPNHLEDTGVKGTNPINPSDWGNDIVSLMHSGYFLLGNLNQIDFTDNINDKQLNVFLGNTHDYSDGVVKPVGLIANPLSLNITTDGDREYISVITGVHGSLRIESIKGWNGSEMGPIAVDGIRVKHCKIEFPGEYKHPDGSFKGRIHPSQLDWLTELVNPPQP